MNGETINQSPMVQSFERVGAQNADLVRENNKNNDFTWMLNKWGRKVPVARNLVAEKLGAGFIHTNGVFESDDLAKRTKTPEAPLDPMQTMSKVLEKMSENSEVQTEALAEIAGVKRGKKKKDLIAEDTQEAV